MLNTVCIQRIAGAEIFMRYDSLENLILDCYSRPIGRFINLTWTRGTTACSALAALYI